jgi:bifunctional DNA-binding transcriptional regulator/antitoxin component of YhaV-PrlF toxin-antitoxin module
MAAKRQKTSVYLEPEQVRRLTDLAEHLGRSQAEIIRDAIARYEPGDRDLTRVRGFGRADSLPRISAQHQVTLPAESLEGAGLRPGDEVAIEADGAGRIVVRRAAPDLEAALGVFDGLYPSDYLEKLRSEERG